MAATVVRAQQSTSTISNYSILQDYANDPYPSGSRDFCNSFWGEGDEGANVLFTRMKSAMKTSDELQNFWTQRAILEEEFGKRLAALARTPIGVDETGELKNSLQTLAIETHRQSESHMRLALNIRRELVEPVARFHEKQIERKRTSQSPIEKKLKAKQSQASYVAKAREKYEGDCVRIKTYKQQAAQLQGQDLDRLQVKLRRALETVKANEKDYASFVRGLSDQSKEWETDWKTFSDDCQDLEEERMELMKDNVWNYANMISTICVQDDEACEKIRTALDMLEPDRELLAFVDAYGTGSRVTEPPMFVTGDPQKQQLIAAPTSYRVVRYERISRKPEAVYQNAPVGQATPPAPNAEPRYQTPPAATPQAIQSSSSTQADVRANGVNGLQPSRSTNGYDTRQNAPAQTRPQIVQPSTSYSSQVNMLNIPPPPPIPEEPRRPMRRGMSLRRESQPLPAVPHGSNRVIREPPAPVQPPVPVTDAGNQILFLVKALYDYRATIEEEFDFQTGDIIAVTETPDDGWWSGELLDEARREPGRHIFPSNYVCLF
ncbi:SH3 domain-containing protein [Amanita rubescens]|nr:SH3 domain-containing protein [Amanita rubescens]KAF8340948.1 SH3 domain-containing protein [Amanita rubescens]